jgi:GxxExxY protein
MYLHEELTHKIIAAAIEVHKNLGPGLLEAVYLDCLGFELENYGLQFQKELNIPISYKGKQINRYLRMDCLIENSIVLEVKSIDTILPVHEAQLLTYLRFSGKEIGLLINFNVAVLKHGIRRRILSLDSSKKKILTNTEQDGGAETLRQKKPPLVRSTA